MKNISERGVLALLVCYQCVFVSCREYAPTTEREFFVGEYQRNFEAAFGKISPTQHWDFSQVDVSASKTKAAEPPLYDFLNADGSYWVSSEQIAAVKQYVQFRDRVDHSFALQIRENDSFCLIPVYYLKCATSGYSWDLQVVVDGEIIVKPVGRATGWPMTYDMVGLSADKACPNSGFKCFPIVKYENLSQEDKLMYFNLYITGVESDTYWKYAPNNTQQSSLDYQMRIVDMPVPAEISDDYKTLFIACETAGFERECPLNNGLRYQSFVFMMVGPRDRFPKVVEVADADGLPFVIKSEKSKRYMIEDLGSTSDFDFNDIVVDIVQREEAKVEITRTVKKDYTKTAVALSLAQRTTQATISHLCGTLPLQVRVGDHLFDQIVDPTTRAEGWNPDIKASLADYDFMTNDIGVTIWRNGIASDGKGAWNVDFPVDGQVPFIMAVPLDTPITEEGVMFTDWLKFVGKD